MTKRAIVLLCALAAGCSSETAIVLTVDGDLVPGADADAVEAFLWHEGEQVQAFGRRLTGDSGLPLTFRMTPPSRGRAEADVVAAALASGQGVLEARRTISFARGSEEQVRLCLWARCIADPALEGCGEGSCDVPAADGDADGDVDADVDGDADGDADGDVDGDPGDGGEDGGVDGSSDADVDEAAPLLCDDHDGDGTADEPGAIGDPLTITASLGSFPAVHWNGSAYGVAWLEEGDPREVRFRTVDAAGESMSSPALLSSGGLAPRDVTVSSDGTGFAVAWAEDRGGGSELALAFVSAAGEAEGGVIAVTDGHADTGRPSLAWNGTEWGLAFMCNYNPSTYDGRVCFARVSSAGEPVGTPVQLTGSVYYGRTFLRWAGTEYVLVHSADCPVEVLRLDSEGAPLGAGQRTYCAPEASLYVENTCVLDVAVSWTGEEHLLAMLCSGSEDWTDYWELQLVRLSDVGASIGEVTGVLAAGTDVLAPNLAWNGEEALLAWTNGGPGLTRAAAVSPSGELSRPFRVRTGTLRGLEAAGTTFSAVWERAGIEFAHVNVCR